MIKQLLEKLMEYHGDLTTGNICAKVMVQVEAQAKEIEALSQNLDNAIGLMAKHNALGDWFDMGIKQGKCTALRGEGE